MAKKDFLSIDQLSVEFKTRDGVVEALQKVSLSLCKGEILGVVGESGSGKSVTAFTVIGLLDEAGSVSHGSTNFDGMNLTSMGEKDLQNIRGREISMIFQNPRAALNPIRPVGKQIEDVLLRHSQATRQDAKERAISMLEKVKILSPEARYWAYPFELSGGMCQRVMIAVALACKPRLLIADEPTTGLDVTTQKATMDLIKELTRDENLSVMLITHDLGMAAAYCDHLVVMKKGRVVEAAPVVELFTTPSHPYTKKLIAASPGPKSTLADLTDVAGEIKDDVSSVALKPKTLTQPFIPPALHTDNLLEVVRLVKEFPSRDTPSNKWFWQKRDTKEQVFRAVDDISFTLKHGETLGLVGESGCGKSTTSSIITRLLDPTSGDVILNGQNITTYRSSQFAKMPQRTQIQMVFQDPTDSLNPRYTAMDSIAEPLKRLMSMKDSGEIKGKVSSLAEMVGLPQSLLSRFPHQMSGGQKARVGIARAIAVDPQLVIMDEPTSALDVSVQAVVLQLLDDLKTSLGMSYLFVSHDLNVVRLLCDNVIVMNKGRIVEQGSTEQVLESPTDAYTRKLIDAIPHFNPGTMENNLSTDASHQGMM